MNRPTTPPPGAPTDASRILRDLLNATDTAHLPELIGALAAAQAQAWARLAAPAPATERQADSLVGAVELAHRLDVTEGWVRDAARRGRIPVVHCGAHLRFDLADVLAAIKAGSADLPDRGILSERGRKAAEHRIVDPARQKRRSKGKDFSALATTLQPPSPADSTAIEADVAQEGVHSR